jgi:hypothetical protein
VQQIWIDSNRGYEAVTVFTPSLSHFVSSSIKSYGGSEVFLVILPFGFTMEGLAAASSVLAVVGIAGQVAQGCNYLRGVFSAAKSAPEELRLLLTELEIIEQIVLSIPNKSEYYEVLDLCDKAIKKLGKLVDKYSEMTSSGDCKRWSRRLGIAIGVNVIQKHVTRLRAAKRHLLDIHNL